MTREDAEKGRMSVPQSIDDIDLGAHRLHPRFGVEQGTKDDGSLKIRAVDNLSWSGVSGRKRRKLGASVNGHCRIPDALRHDHIDDLMEASTSLHDTFGEAPGLWKADIDSAFRRIPIVASMLWSAMIAFLVDGKVRPNFSFVFCVASAVAAPFVARPGMDLRAPRNAFRCQSQRLRLGTSGASHRHCGPESAQIACVSVCRRFLCA